MIKKSAIIKLSNPYLFQKIKSSLSPCGKFSEIEARIILKQNRDRLFHDPNTPSFRFFLVLAREAFQREDYNEAFRLINRVIELLPQSSLSGINLKNLKNANDMNGLNDLDRARIYELAGYIYKRNYRIQGSIQLLERSLRILNIILGEDNIYSKDLTLDLADSYLKNYRGNEAIFYFYKFLNLRNTQFRKLEEIEMFVLKQIGLAYNYKNGPKIALRVFKKILIFSQNCSIKYNKILFSIFWEVATIYSNTRNKYRAKKCYLKCFKSIKKCYFSDQISKEEIYNLLVDYYYWTMKMYDHSLCIAKRAIKDLVRSKKDNLLEIIRIYKYISYSYSEKNNMKKFVYYFEKHMVLLKNVVGPKHPIYLHGLIHYIRILCNLKELYRQSLKRLKGIKEELKDVFKLNLYLKAKYKFLKGKVYLDLNWTKKSFKKLEEAKSILLENFSKNDPLYMNCCYEIGRNLHLQQNLEEALVSFTTAFEISLRIFSYFDIYCACILFQIAAVYANKGLVSCSLEYYKRSLDIYCKLNLRDTYSSKLIYLKIAELYLKQGKYQHFFYYLKTSLKTGIENIFGRHQYCDSFLSILVLYFHQMRMNKAARIVINKQLKNHINSDRYNHSDTILRITELALCELSIAGKNSYSKAKKLFVMSTNLYTKLIEKQKIPQKNYLAVIIYKFKAKLYEHLGKYENCLNILRHALNLNRYFYNKNDYQMMDLYVDISHILLETKRFNECIHISKRALKIQDKTFGNPGRVSEFYFKIICSYLQLGRIDEALKYAKIIITIKEKVYNSSDIEMKESYNNIGMCYFRQNKLDQALKCFIKAFSNAKVSRNMNLTECCISNNIGNIYACKQLFHRSLDIIKSCLESARTNKFPEHYVKVFTRNLQIISKEIEIRSKFNDEGKNNNQVSQTYMDELFYLIGKIH